MPSVPPSAPVPPYVARAVGGTGPGPIPELRAVARGAGAPTGSDPGRAVPEGTRAVAAGAAELKSPDWVKDAVFYQVFPERFRNGDTANDPAGTVPWGTPPQNDQFFMGGDLDGVTQKLGHLAKLGVNALYLNPIFTSPSNHKYDTTDYAHVDPAFGGDAAFSELVDKAHAGGMKLILDGVLNHTSNEHVWFNDVKERGSASTYWSWYNVFTAPDLDLRGREGDPALQRLRGLGQARVGRTVRDPAGAEEHQPRGARRASSPARIPSCGAGSATARSTAGAWTSPTRSSPRSGARPAR